MSHPVALDVAAILGGLGEAGIDYVLTGSVAAAAYGVPVAPRDLDIAPALDTANLTRLADLLRRWNARPIPIPEWPEGLTPAECARWVPDPPSPEQLDHLMTTPHGLFDVVPIRSGRFSDLVRRALSIDYESCKIRVAHPEDLISSLRLHQQKHRDRVIHLHHVRGQLERGEELGLRLPRVFD